MTVKTGGGYRILRRVGTRPANPARPPLSVVLPAWTARLWPTVRAWLLGGDPEYLYARAQQRQALYAERERHTRLGLHSSGQVMLLPRPDTRPRPVGDRP